MSDLPKYVHIFPREKFTSKYIVFINRYFPSSEHLFIIIPTSAECDELPKADNIAYLDKLSSASLRNLLNKCEGIIVHQLNFSFVVKYCLLNKKIKKKICWIVWGSDAYEYEHLCNTLKGRLRINIKRSVIKNIPFIGTFAHEDCLYVKSKYGFDGECFDVLYPSTVDGKQVQQIYDQRIPHDYTNIIIGNSATDTNQHLPALDIISKFKDENVNVFVPLSYGDDSYREKVLKIGAQLFGDKFKPILNFMSPIEYSELLGTMDVALFNNNRQQATGNIELLAYFGVKVYLRNDTTMWDHFVIRNQLRFYNIDDIKQMSFSDFVRIPENELMFNHSYFARVWDENTLYNIWNGIFEVFRREY